MNRDAQILVVDDEPRSLELLVRTLRDLGEVHTALSGDQAWEKTRAGPRLDVVISDQRMPGTSGVELLERFANQDEQMGRILLTGYADIGATIDAINRGRVHAYVPKPWSPEQLQLTVRTLIERVRYERENERLLADLAEKNRELEEAMCGLREAQQQSLDAERLAAIGRMIAMIVHDLRGPLSVIRSSSNGLLEGDLPAGERLELARAVHEECERMSRMCSELLEMTRASVPSGQRMEHELDELVGDAARRAAIDAAHAAVTVEMDLASNATVCVDAERIRRAILNLAYNAVEAMPDGGMLRISTSRESGEAVVSVADSGVGISEDIASRVFEPFFTSGKSGGSGLGLAIVKKIVDDHDGRIELGKPEGGGTVFHVRLRLAGA